MRKIGILVILMLIVSSCGDILEMEDISSDSVILVAPYDHAVLKVTILNFSWEPVIDAEEYQIQIAVPNFENPLQIVVDSTLATHQASFNLESNTYQWRVKAMNSAYGTKYSTQGFTVEE